MGFLFDDVPQGGKPRKGILFNDLPAPSFQPHSEPEQSVTDQAINLAGEVWDNFTKPAAAALDVISYLDKPRGAIAGTAKAYQDDTPLLEGAQKGWQENTSWKETFDREWVKDNPTTATLAGFATDVLLDPLNVLTPAKIVAGVAKGSKAVGLTDKAITPAVNAIRRSETGQKAFAVLEDLTGVNRVQEAQDAFRAGRASDMVKGQDIIDEVQGLKKQYGTEADKLTEYVEATNRGGVITPAVQDSVLNSYNSGKLLEDIKAGRIDKPAAFDTLRDVGEEIPDYLLQEPQRVAKKAGQSIPDYKYRDEVLAGIPNTGLRTLIQSIGDKVAAENKRIQDVMSSIGRLGDEAVVRFQEGSHLRRSFDKYESPEKFLNAVREHGTPEEFRRVYQDLTNSKAPGRQGFGKAHSVDMRDFTQRQVLSEETLNKLGAITDPEYRVMDTFNRASKTIREDEFLTKVSKMFGVGADQAADLSRNLSPRRQYVPVPEGAAYGALAGQWVPRDVADQVSNALGMNRPEGLTAALQKIVSWWKVGKLANPASIMRNFYSGIPMANVFGQVPFQDMPREMARIYQAYKSGGKNSPILRELRETGILGNDWARQDLKNILGDNPTGIKKYANWGMEAFGAPDKFWRAVVFSHHRNAGRSVKEAAAIANRALFDYSQAPEWVNKLSRTGAVPFAKFPYFAAKETGRALYERPAQVTKYTKLQNQDNTADREKILPEYLKTRQLLPIGEGTRTVNGKPQKVQNNIDLDYILPFANDISFGNPAVDAVQLYRTGQNGLGQQVIKPGMTTEEKAKEAAYIAANSLAPAVAAPYTRGKLIDGAQGNVDRQGRQYDLPSALAQVFAGVKNVPINVDEMYKQKMNNIAFQQRSVVARMNEIKKDGRLTPQEKKARMEGHMSQYRELVKQAQESQKAYQREKKRGAL